MNAKCITQLLGNENAVLVEHEAVGHTTFAQYSICTHDIVSNFLIRSEVGYGSTFAYCGLALTRRIRLQLSQHFTNCAVDPNNFFPDNG